MRINGKFGALMAGADALVLSSCTATGSGSESKAGEATGAANGTQGPIPEYAQKDGDTYMYVGTVSDEEKRQGKTAPVVNFRNLGLNGNVQKLQIVGDNGVALGTFECSAPCRVAKNTNLYGTVTRQAVEPATILAAAFRDASNGFLQVTDISSEPAQLKASPTAVNLNKSAPSEQAFPAGGSFQVPDFYGRDKKFSMYKTKIVEGMREEGANFYGHYTIINIGCGTGCTVNFLIDRETGIVSDIPYGGEEQQTLTLRHNINSDVIDATWFDGDVCMSQQARWDGKAFSFSGDPTSIAKSLC